MSRGVSLLFVSILFKFALTLLLSWIFWLFISGFSTIFIERATVLEYSQKLLQKEWEHFNSTEQHDFFDFFNKTAKKFNERIMNAMHQELPSLKSNAFLKIKYIENQNYKYISHAVSKILRDYLKLEIMVTQVFLIRAFNLISMLPLLAILGILGFIDGLNQRYIRRLQGGRESAFLYQRARQMILPSFLCGCVFYNTLPIYISAQWCLLPFLLFFAVSLSAATRLFKKYL